MVFGYDVISLVGLISSLIIYSIKYYLLIWFSSVIMIVKKGTVK